MLCIVVLRLLGKAQVGRRTPRSREAGWLLDRSTMTSGGSLGAGARAQVAPASAPRASGKHPGPGATGLRHL